MTLSNILGPSIFSSSLCSTDTSPVLSKTTALTSPILNALASRSLPYKSLRMTFARFRQNEGVWCLKKRYRTPLIARNELGGIRQFQYDPAGDLTNQTFTPEVTGEATVHVQNRRDARGRVRGIATTTTGTGTGTKNTFQAFVLPTELPVHRTEACADPRFEVFQGMAPVSHDLMKNRPRRTEIRRGPAAPLTHRVCRKTLATERSLVELNLCRARLEWRGLRADLA